MQAQKDASLPSSFNKKDSLNLNWENKIPMEQISALLAAEPQTAISNTHFLNTAFQTEQGLLNQEYLLEVAEKNQIVDFVQIRRSGDPSELLKEKISLSLGIQLPLKGSHKLKIEELEVEQAQNKAEYELRTQWLEQKIERTQRQMLIQLKTYQRFLELKKLEQKKRPNFSQ